MKIIHRAQAGTSTLGTVANVAAACLLASFAAMFLTYINVVWNPGYYGQYGLAVTGRPAPQVFEVVPGSPADKAGLKVGEMLERPSSLRDRLVLIRRVAARPGESVTVSIVRGKERSTITLRARPAAALSASERVTLCLQYVGLAMFLGVGFVLVLLRPNRTTWGFYLCAVGFVIVYGSDSFFSYIAPGRFVALDMAENLVAIAGIPGFLIFCVRFPSDAPRGWRRVADTMAPLVFVGLAPFPTYGDIAWFDFTRDTSESISGHVVNDTALLIFTIGALVVLMTYLEARGPERHRIKWVVAGLGCVFAVLAVGSLRLEGMLSGPDWLFSGINLLVVAFPLAVAYAVIRHRVIDIHFVASRSLAFGVLAAVVTLMVIAIDWVLSTWLPASRFQAAVYAGVALLVGLSLNAAWQSLRKIIDLVFFRRWYQTREQAATIDDEVRVANSKADLYEPLTAGVAGAFSLASTALFERVEGGGFVRVAAYGWLPGTIWHILPDDPPALRAGSVRRTVDLDSTQWSEVDLPAGVARPAVSLAIVAGKHVAALLLCGAHKNGAGLDPDGIRALRRLCADAGLVYGRSPAGESEPAALLGRRVELLGA